MGLTTALYTSLSGLNANAQLLNVTGNNIANLNTTSYKASRALFETQFSQSISGGSAPTANSGGTNPSQIGLGTRIGTIRRDFSPGSIQITGINTDLAVEGDGFFKLLLNGVQRFTRDGSFSLDRDFRLVNSDGGFVQGFSVDADYNIVEGVEGNLQIGTRTLAEATSTVNFKGNLNSGGDAATTGAMITSAPIYSDAGATVPAVAGDSLDSLFDGLGTQLFATGDVIALKDVEKGGSTLPTRTFEVGPTNASSSDSNGTMLQDFLDFVEDVLGIETSVSGGVSMSALGELVIDGNSGEANDLTLDNGAVIVNQTSTNSTLPFDLTKQKVADGESVRTTFLAYDSLGNALTIDLNVVLEEKTNAGTKWRFYVQSEDDSDLDRALGTGTADFDPNGQLITLSNASFTIDRANTGAFTPQQIAIAFSNHDGTVASVVQQPSELAAISSNGSGAPAGTLESFSVSDDGRIAGAFSNGLLRDLGQIPLATFSNPEGLEEVGGNLFRVTTNSGIAVVVKPGTGGAGRVLGGALELSNVDLSQEFIDLISASTGFTANSRVLTTSDRLIQELLATLR